MYIALASFSSEHPLFLLLYVPHPSTYSFQMYMSHNYDNTCNTSCTLCYDYEVDLSIPVADITTVRSTFSSLQVSGAAVVGGVTLGGPWPVRTTIRPVPSCSCISTVSRIRYSSETLMLWWYLNGHRKKTEVVLIARHTDTVHGPHIGTARNFLFQLWDYLSLKMQFWYCLGSSLYSEVVLIQSWTQHAQHEVLPLPQFWQ